MLSNIQTVSIEQASFEDIGMIVAWTEKLHHHEDDGDLKTHQNFSDNLEKWLTLELNNPNSLFLIFQYNERPAGFIFANSVFNDNGFLENPIKGVVHLLWVDEEYRGNNIAAKLLTEVEKCFLSIGISYVECNYTANNHLARLFWNKQGYQQRSITARKILEL